MNDRDKEIRKDRKKEKETDKDREKRSTEKKKEKERSIAGKYEDRYICRLKNKKKHGL